jgi:hypothetical protein
MFSVGDMYFFHKKAISENTAENRSYLPKVGLYNATHDNSFSFNIGSFRKWAYCVGYEDAWRSLDYERIKNDSFATG